MKEAFGNFYQDEMTPVKRENFPNEENSPLERFFTINPSDSPEKILRILNSIDSLDERFKKDELARVLQKLELTASSYLVRLRAGSIHKKVFQEDTYQKEMEKAKNVSEHLKSIHSHNLPTELSENTNQAISSATANGSIVSEVSRGWCAAHTPEGKLIGFFPLGKVDKENLKTYTTEEMFAKEGFAKEGMTKESFEDLVLVFETLMDPGIRQQIESDFHINLFELSVREEIQFLNYISHQKPGGIEKVQHFVTGANPSSGRINRFRSFLAMETNPELRDFLLEIDSGKIAMKDESKNILFQEYAKLIDDSEKIANDLVEVVKNTFPNRKINQATVLNALMHQSVEIFKEMRALFLTAKLGEGYPEKVDLIEQLIGFHLRKKINHIVEISRKIRERRASQKKELIELKEIVETMNRHYSELTRSVFEKNILKSLQKANSGSTKVQWMVGREFKRIKETSRKMAPPGFEFLYGDFLDEEKKFDSERLRKMIAHYRSLYTLIPEDIAKIREGSAHLPEEEREAEVQKIVAETEASEEVRPFRETYAPLVKKLEELLRYQENLERRLEKMIYGQESPSLPGDFFKGFGEKIESPEKEELPEQSPLYFPVGISSKGEQWEKVLRGEMRAAKPIDIYNYLFWLNNQGRKVKFFVADRMQIRNYPLLFPEKSPAEIKSLVEKIGEWERTFYRETIERLGLKNIELVEYDQYRKDLGEGFGRYFDFTTKLAEKPAWSKAFLEMVKKSIGKSSQSESERKKHLPYALEEMAWILGADGTKVTHPEEASYDILSAVIQNAESKLKSENLTLEDLLSFDSERSPENRSNNDQKIALILFGVLKGLEDELNKPKRSNGSDQDNYVSNLREILKMIPRPKLPGGMTAGDKRLATYKKVSFNFFCPDLASRSFGFRKSGKKEEKISFKEPYSTYFYSGIADLFLDSDQVVAIPNSHIGGKILTMKPEIQMEYANKVLRPLLIGFFRSIESAPENYFLKAGKNRSEMMAECQSSSTLSDLLSFIRKYIVTPSDGQEIAPQNMIDFSEDIRKRLSPEGHLDSPVYPSNRKDVAVIRAITENGNNHGYTIYLVWRDAAGKTRSKRLWKEDSEEQIKIQSVEANDNKITVTFGSDINSRGQSWRNTLTEIIER